MLEKSELENVLPEKAEIFLSQFRYVSNFFSLYIYIYNAVVCSIIVFGSVCWGGNISNLIKGGWKRLSKKAHKKQKKTGHVVGMPLDSFKTHMKN